MRQAPGSRRPVALAAMVFVLLACSAVVLADAASAPGLFTSLPANGSAIVDSQAVYRVNVTDASDLRIARWRWNGSDADLFDDSLVLALHLDNNAGLGESSTVAKDAGRQGRTLSVSSSKVSFAGGSKYGSGAVFSGDTTSQDTGIRNTSFNPSFNNQFTFTVWAKRNALMFQERIIEMGLSGCSGREVNMMTDGGIQIYNGGWMTTTCTGTVPAVDTAWHHYAIAFNNRVWTEYRDGVKTRNCTGDKDVPAINEVLVGGCFSCFGYGVYNGTIDELRVYNRSLSAAEIGQAYRSNLRRLNGSVFEFISDQTDIIGRYSYSFSAIDTYGNTNTTGVRNVNVTSGLPVVESIVLNTTNPATNDTNQNLTLNVRVSDADGDPVKNITNWYRNGTGIAVLSMPFEARSNSANNATDYSGFGNNGTVVSATFNASGGFDGRGAYMFDGVDDKVSVAYGSSLSLQNAVTLSAWIKSASSGRLMNVLTKMQYVSDADNSGYGVFISSSNDVACMFTFNNNADYSICGTKDVIDGKWHHVVGTFAGGVRRLYVDGVQDVGDTASIGSLRTNTNILNIGGRELNNPYDSGRWFNGTLDEVRVYNRSLSAAQVRALYANRTDVMVADETEIGEAWSACVTPNDGTQDGARACSNNVTILGNLAPVVESIVLNSTNPATNDTDQNLTLNVRVSDVNGDSVKNITNWYRNGTGITLLNMPFEARTNAANNATDYSGFGNNGTVSGAVFNASRGYDGKAAYVFGGSQYISVPGSQIRPSSSLAVEAWFKQDGTGSDGSTSIVAKWNNAAGQRSWQVIYNESSDTVRFQKRNAADTGVDMTDWVGASANVWHHVAAVFDDASDRLLLYVDGQLGSNVSVSSGMLTSTLDVLVGSQFLAGVPGDPGYSFNGVIDEVRVWNRSLSAAQVRALYLNRSGLVVAEETSVGDVWRACVTPNDGVQDGVRVCSDDVSVLATNAIVIPPSVLSGFTVSAPWGNVSNGSGLVVDTVLTVVESSGSRPKVSFTGLFSQGAVNLSNVTLNFTADKTVFSAGGAAGVSANHTLYVPIGTGAGVYVCPSAVRLDQVDKGCAGVVKWSHAEALAGVLKSVAGNMVSATVDGPDYKVSGLMGTGVGSGGSADLVIWDETESDGSLFAGQTRYAGDQVRFFANFTNSTGLPANITNGGCRVDFAAPAYDGLEGMVYNSTFKLFMFNRSFAGDAVYGWQVNCTGQGDVVNASDSVVISAVSGEVPEFGSWALLLALGLVVAGVARLRPSGRKPGLQRL